MDIVCISDVFGSLLGRGGGVLDFFPSENEDLVTPAHFH